MAELKRKPIVIKVGKLELVGFDEDHTLSDIIRYAIEQSDADEIEALTALLIKESRDA